MLPLVQSAPGPNGITNEVYARCSDLLVPFLGPIFRGTFKYEVYPAEWHHYFTFVLRKLERPDYHVAKAYRPIALLDCLAKILSA